MSGSDWQTLVARHWNRRPVVVPATAPLDAAQAHRVMVRASAPFRAGTQAHAVTRVRFHTDRGRLVVPGHLLPQEEDAALPGYLDRLSGLLGEEGWLCTVEQPFADDFPNWARVRAHLATLWERVPQPSAPLRATLTCGERYRQPSTAPDGSSGAGVVIWVLHGEVEVALRAVADGAPDRAVTEPGADAEPGRNAEPGADADAGRTSPGDVIGRGPGNNLAPSAASAPPGPVPEGADHLLRGRAGDLLYCPPGYLVSERRPGPAVTLRLTVPVGDAAAERAVGEALGALVRSQRPAGERQPVIKEPAAAAEAVPLPEGLAPLASATSAAARQGALEAALRTRWLARRSAAGLEPAPPPEQEAGIGPGATLTVVGEILEARIGERTLWAVNGHTLPVGGGTASRIHQHLRPGRVFTPATLYEEVGARPEHHPGVLALLRTLLRLRLLESGGLESSGPENNGLKDNGPATDPSGGGATAGTGRPEETPTGAAPPAEPPAAPTTAGTETPGAIR